MGDLSGNKQRCSPDFCANAAEDRCGVQKMKFLLVKRISALKLDLTFAVEIHQSVSMSLISKIIFAIIVQLATLTMNQTSALMSTSVSPRMSARPLTRVSMLCNVSMSLEAISVFTAHSARPN